MASGNWPAGRRAQAEMEFTGQYIYRNPIQAKDRKDIPEPSYIPGNPGPGRSLVHEWLTPVDVNKLSKCQMNVKMCCPKCEEKVLEEIWEVPGVFDVKAFRIDMKVVVTYVPWPIGLDVQHEVLKKARKIDCKASFTAIDPPKPPPEPCNGGKGKACVTKDCPPCPTERRIILEVPPIRVVQEYRPGPFCTYPEPCCIYPVPCWTYRPAGQDGVAAYYFFIFFLLLVSMFFFRK